MNQTKTPRVGFTAAEIKIFKVHAVLMAALAAGLYVAAPKGLGQVLGVLFAAVLLPVPAGVIYFLRKQRASK